MALAGEWPTELILGPVSFQNNFWVILMSILSKEPPTWSNSLPRAHQTLRPKAQGDIVTMNTVG